MLISLHILDYRSLDGIVLPIRFGTNLISNGRKNTTVALLKGRTVGVADVEVVRSVLKLQQ